MPKPICENSNFFNNAELEKTFVKLQNHILKLSHMPAPVLTTLLEDEVLPMPPQSIMHELEELAIQYDSRIVPELVPFTQGFYHAEQLKEYIEQKKTAATNLQHQTIAEESKMLEDEYEASSKDDVESADNTEKLKENDVEYNEDFEEVNEELSAEAERIKLIELKEKYCYMPMLLMLLLTSSTGGKTAEKELQLIASIRESIMEMFMRDINWLSKEQKNEKTNADFAKVNETLTKTDNSSKRPEPSLTNAVQGVSTKRTLIKESSPTKARLLAEVTEADSKFASISPEFIALCQVLTITSQLAVFFKSCFNWLGW